MECKEKIIKVEYEYSTLTARGYEVTGTPFGLYQDDQAQWLITDLAGGKIRATKASLQTALDLIDRYMKV